MKKINKNIKFIFMIFLLIIIYVIVLNIPKNYEIDYIINKVKINEKYDKHTRQYTLILTYENIDYPLIIDSKYLKKRKLIKNIKIASNEKDTCLSIDYLDNNKIICSDLLDLKDYRLINDKLYSENYEKIIKPIKETTYENIKIYNTDETYLIWNYNGYLKISETNEKINILNEEKYNNQSTYQNERYLIIPDYDSSYYFKKIYIYDTEKNNLSNITFNYEISYNLLYLGTFKNKVYILDLKNKNEYELNLKKKTIKLLNEKDNYGLFLNGNKLEHVKVDTLVKNEKVFASEINNNYSLEDNTLYMNIDRYKLKVSNQKINEIVRIIDDTVYYLVDDTLYRYNEKIGEEQLLKYKEWKYNYHNQIFIFNN